MVAQTLTSTRSILVVDDDHSFSRSIYSLLDSMQLDVYRARNAQEAIDMLEELEPDVILLDMVLPDVSGLSLLRRLRTSGQHRGRPILMTSGMVMSGDRGEALDAGANGFLPKPFSIAELDSALQPVVGPHFLLT